MSINRTKIEWTDATWNPLTGCYGPGGTKERPRHCPYCYALRIARRFAGGKAFPHGFEPTFHPERLYDPETLKKPSRIFACSMSDMFGSWNRDEWVASVFDMMRRYENHVFQVLTKNPENLARWEKRFPKNLWLGVSVAAQADAARIGRLKEVCPAVLFVSFEPLLGPVTADLEGIGWIIVGAQTRPERPPEREWVGSIIAAARKEGVPVFLKDNLRWPERIREFPGSKIGNGEKCSAAFKAAGQIK